MLRQSRPGRVKQCFWRFLSISRLLERNSKFCNNVFCAWVCRSGVPSFSTIDQTMKMLGAKAFWVVFRIFFFFSEGIFKKEPDQRIQFRKTNKVGKFEVKKVKDKGAVSKNVVRVAISPRSPFKKLIITTVSGKPLTARNCLSFCGPPECNGGPAAGA